MRYFLLLLMAVIFTPIPEHNNTDKIHIIVVVTDPPICEPCRKLDPVLRTFKRRHKDIPLITVKTLSCIKTLPTIIYKGDQLQGVVTLDQLEQFVRDRTND